ncbi:MAG: ceramide glucosyltransferase [Alphaproteobacteria bacterium]|jgi:ceramide glucosyltransferase|nr:ceramide glucosyltransferase [Alphaproteobacteria bacterium]MDB5739719.1 ceramide glucosyltransferase [Alphaproteobacteria bacterium]
MNELFLEIGWALAAIALMGAAYALLAALLVGRFMRREPRATDHSPAVTILKPLHQGEPDLLQNLETFFAQNYSGPVQIVFGVHDEADPAMETVRALQAKYPQADTAIVADTALYGANAKISNLINMLPLARHDTLILSDSDIAVGTSWLTQVTAALSRPGVGIVTCLYTGEPAKDGHRLWSSLAAMGTSYEFLPNAVLGTSLGLAAPCMGSTIALKRETLDEVGGFAAFADQLADDYEIGRAVRAKGYTLAIPAMGVGHTTADNSLSDLFHHELRWNRTIRMVNPAGHLGSIVTHGFAFALMAALMLDFSAASLAILAVTLVSRLFLKYRIDGLFGTYAGPYWLVPLRDMLSFVVFVTSLFGETVHWRGADFAVEPSGAMSQV